MTMRSLDAFFDDIALGLMSLFGPWSEHVEPVSWSVDGPIDLVRVRATSGSIIVRGGSQDVVMVRATKTVRGPTAELAERFARRVEVRMTHAGSSVHLQTLYPRPPLGCAVFVRYEITLPWAVDADLHTQSGGILVSGIEGAVEAETRSGNIDLLDTSGPATAHTASGRIHASGVEGAIQAENDQGRIAVEACSGHIRLRTTSGDIEIDGCDGTVRARSYQGSIRLDRGRGSAELETDGGDILAHFERLGAPGVFLTRTGRVDVTVAELQGYLEAESLDGSVRIGLPTGCSAMLDASTNDGTVLCDHPVDATQRSPSLLIGGLGEGYGPLVKLRSFSGDIHVRQQDPAPAEGGTAEGGIADGGTGDDAAAQGSSSSRAES
jgi:hypothetical protein